MAKDGQTDGQWDGRTAINLRRRIIKQAALSLSLSLPHQDDCKTKKDTK